MSNSKKIRGKRSVAVTNPESTTYRIVVRFKDPTTHRRLAVLCAAAGCSINNYVETLILEDLDISEQLNEGNPYLAVTEERRTPDAPTSSTD